MNINWKTEADRKEEQMRELNLIRRQRDDLHGIVRGCLDSLGNGSGATSEASIDFLKGAPQEISIHVASLKKQRDELLAALKEVTNLGNGDAIIYAKKIANEAIAKADLTQ